MTENDIRVTFKDLITIDNYIVIQQNDKTADAVEITAFLSLFSDVELTYDALYNHLNSTVKWKEFFDILKLQGYLT